MAYARESRRRAGAAPTPLNRNVMTAAEEAMCVMEF
jgi:hypothetical protein